LRLAKHDLVVPRLEVTVTEPVEQPLGPPPPVIGEPIPDDDDTVVCFRRPTRFPDPDILYFPSAELARVAPRTIRATDRDFPEIEHEGLIVVIDSTPFLSRTTFETLRRGAARAGVEILPVYVRHLGRPD